MKFTVDTKSDCWYAIALADSNGDIIEKSEGWLDREDFESVKNVLQGLNDKHTCRKLQKLKQMKGE